tara:strand:+ start:1661 stop:3154 length:1494 start_codon:yes stop_codon:yes gene_type:complete
MRRVTLLLLAASLFTGCGDDDGASPDSGPADAGVDAAPAPRDLGQERELTVFDYVPEGCSGTVRTPEVVEAGMGGETLGAAPTPDHVHVAIGEEASTTFAVNWHTDLATDVTQILYGLDEDAVDAADGATDEVAVRSGHTLVYETRYETLTDSLDVRIHEVHVCGLEPSTTYYYKVGGPGAWSETFDVATAPVLGSTEPWTFAASGDSRNNTAGVWQLAQRQILEAGADLHVFSGDAVNLSALQTEWDAFFEAREGDFQVQDALARIPFMVSNGNHDNLRVNYLAQFAMPQDISEGEGGQGEEWYSFDYANAHFVVLNDTVEDDATISGPEADWLRADLAAVDRDVTPWVFAVHHRNLYTCMSSHSPSGQLRTAWQPIYDEFAVDVVFQGHNHVYERSRPIRGLTATNEGVVAAEGAGGEPTFEAPGGGSGEPSGTLYFTAAAIGAPLYEVSDACPTTRAAQGVANYLMVDVDDRSITFTARNIETGAVIDELTYSK